MLRRVFGAIDTNLGFTKLGFWDSWDPSNIFSGIYVFTKLLSIFMLSFQQIWMTTL